MAVDTTEQTDNQVTNEAPAKPAKAKTNWLVNVSVPTQQIKDAIDNWAKGQEKTTSRAVLELLGSTVGFTIPASSSKGRRKYATPELAKEASKASMALRNNRIKVNMRMSTCIGLMIDQGADPMEVATLSMTVTRYLNENDFDGANAYMDERFPETKEKVKEQAAA